MKELLKLSFPILLLSFSTCLLGFFERLCCSSHSVETVETAMSVIYIIRIFQLPCINLAMMGQVFVGNYSGANKHLEIGRCIWQLIWFSLFSMLITVPGSFTIDKLFFNVFSMQQGASFYFLMAVFSNFLFPLGVVLTSFFLGRQRFKLLLLATLGTQALNAGLDFILILGVGSWIPPLGLKGAAFANLISQGLLCCILLRGFLNKSNQKNYGTHIWFFDPKSFWRYLSPSLPRAVGRLVLLAIWAASAYIMTSKGEEALLLLSISGALSLFLSFIGDGLLQSLTVLISHSLGAQRYDSIKRYLRNGFLFLLAVATLLAVPLVFFPNVVLNLFSINTQIGMEIRQKFHTTLFSIWVHTSLYILSSILMSLLLAKKDTLFLLLNNFNSWIISFLPVYVGMNYLHIGADKFWLLVGFGLACSSMIYGWRIHHKKWLSPPAQPSPSIG